MAPQTKTAAPASKAPATVTNLGFDDVGFFDCFLDSRVYGRA